MISALATVGIVLVAQQDLLISKVSPKKIYCKAKRGSEANQKNRIICFAVILPARNVLKAEIDGYSHTTNCDCCI